MKGKNMSLLLIVLCVAAISVACVYAADATNTLKKDAMHSIEVKDGKLIDTSKNEEIGTVKQINSTDEGESEIFSYDSEAIEKVVSDDPLVTEYIVEDTTDSSNSGIYWMFGHDGKIFLAFNPTEKMGNGMLNRMTEFCKVQGIL